MKVIMLYRPNSEHERQALDYQRDFTAQTGKELSAMDADSPAGSELCRLYDIMNYPAILVTDNDGVLQTAWSGEHLPTFSELSYYFDGHDSQEILHGGSI